MFEFSQSLVNFNDSIIVCGNGYNYIKYGINFQTIDSCSKIKNYKSVENTNKIYSLKRSIIINNKIYSFGGELDTSNYFAKGRVFILENYDEGIQTFQFNKTNDFFNNGIYTSNHQIIAIGSGVQDSLSNYDMLAVCFDTLGNELWHNYYGYAGWNSGWSITEVADGYVLVGGTENGVFPSYINPLITVTVPAVLVVKIDFSGNEVWKQYFNYQSYYIPDILTSNDGNVIITYSRFHLSYPDVDLSTDGIFIAYRKLNYLDGSLIYENYALLDSQHYENAAIRTIKLADGSYISCGETFNYVAEKTSGMIVKVDSNLNIVWAKEYRYNANGYHLIWDVAPRPEGGFWACGQGYVDDTTQGFWLLGIDENGNLLDTCNTTTEVIDMMPKTLTMSVYPNPASTQLSVSWAGGAAARIVVRNAQGAIVLEQQILTDNATINIHNLANGIYTVQIIDKKGRTGSSKFIKQ
jgi:hypothetical protein